MSRGLMPAWCVSGAGVSMLRRGRQTLATLRADGFSGSPLGADRFKKAHASFNSFERRDTGWRLETWSWHESLGG